MDYPSMFDRYYYEHNCGKPYERTQDWLDFFDGVAKRLIEDFQPHTVLDAGCAWGFLVERLRARGVEAYGIDISEYAISQVHPDIQPYCRVGSITEPFPQTYDLIVSIEVLEHMQPADAERAVENFSKHSDQIVFSSSPYDYKEATHFNVLQSDGWARLFARYGLFRDIDYDLTAFLTPWAGYFRRISGNPVQPLVQAYERKLLTLQNEVKELRVSVLEHHSKLQECSQRLESALQESSRQASVNLVSQQLQEKEKDYEAMKAKADALEQHWLDVQQGRGWKMLQKIQALRVWLFPPGGTREKVLNAIFKR